MLQFDRRRLQSFHPFDAIRFGIQNAERIVNVLQVRHWQSARLAAQQKVAVGIVCAGVRCYVADCVARLRDGRLGGCADVVVADVHMIVDTGDAIVLPPPERIAVVREQRFG